MKKYILLIIAGAFIFYLFKSEWKSAVSTTNVNGIKQNDFEDVYRFLSEEADECRRNIELGKLAKERSDKKAIKEFGVVLVNDYSTLLQKIEMLAAERDMQLPNVLSYAKFQKLDKLRKKDGRSFDRLFLKIIDYNTRKNINTLKGTYPFGDEELQTLIQDNLILVQGHMDSLKKVKKSV